MVPRAKAFLIGIREALPAAGKPTLAGIVRLKTPHREAMRSLANNGMIGGPARTS